MSPAPEPDHYRTLGVLPTATADEISTAYRLRARAVHPDHHPNNPLASELTRKLNEAYAVLKEPGKRQKYDERRASPQRKPKPATPTVMKPARTTLRIRPDLYRPRPKVRKPAPHFLEELAVLALGEEQRQNPFLKALIVVIRAAEAEEKRKQTLLRFKKLGQRMRRRTKK